MPWLWIPPRGKLEKRLHFHRAVEMKQAHIVTASKLFGRAAQRRPPADEHEPDSRPAGLGAHRGTHAFSGFQTIPHLQGHLFQRRHIAGGLHDVHERFGTELCAGVIGVHFTQKGRIGLPDSLRDSLSTDRAFENEIMDSG